ncbi:phage head-tail joining protein [Paracoccus chinensis]|uniref:GpW protein n=1 Tax=Paracoccus chinensis TaxID=525640 RepID=A0A1G9H801_9RHOB|nr:hypothetical protein [Paracoccus chinensis]SDL09148.1 hypothetical protein SAMN04487971_10668 [Paracoccus chinensis]
MALSYDEEVELRAAIPALRLAIVSGTLRVTYDGKTVEYRSIAEMKEALRYAEDTLGRPARPSAIRFTSSKGF